MGLMFLPGSADAPAHAEMVFAPAAPAQEDEEPSKRLATSLEVAPSYSVHLTAYNAVSGQTDGDPSVTASGAPSNPEVVAARSRDLAEELPFGTVVRIERARKDTSSCRFSQVEHLIGYRVIADSMHSRWTNKVDVLFDGHDTVSVHGTQTNPSIALGVCDGVTVSVVGHVDIDDLPATQDELAQMFTDQSFARK